MVIGIKYIELKNYIVCLICLITFLIKILKGKSSNATFQNLT